MPPDTGFNLVVFRSKSSREPGSKIKKKLGFMDSQSRLRRLATSTSMGSPPSENPRRSPTVRFSCSAMPCSTETPGRPEEELHSCHQTPASISLSSDLSRPENQAQK